MWHFIRASLLLLITSLCHVSYLSSQAQVIVTPSSFGKQGTHKFGENRDVNSGTLPEDLWDLGGVYPFPAAAAVTTVESSVAADDAGSTGCEEVTYSGLDADSMLVTGTVALDGTNPVPLPDNLYRFNRAFCGDVGVGGVNAGDLTFQHGATVIGIISAGRGQTETAIYSIPKDYSAALLIDLALSVFRDGGTTARIAAVLFYRADASQSWRVLDNAGLSTAGSALSESYEVNVYLQPGADIRWTVVESSANGLTVTGSFDIVEVR